MGRRFDMSLLSRHRLFAYGIATVLVLTSHMKTVFPAEGIWRVAILVRDYGMVGVEIFLLLAGFGLYGSLTRNSSIARFYGRRLTRVFLPAFIIAAVYYSLGYVSLGDYLASITVVPYFWTGRSFWYVAFILVMYAVYPLLFSFQKRSRTAFAVFCGIVSAVTLAACAVIDMPYYLQRAVTRIPVFLFGCTIAPWVIEGRKLKLWILPAAIGAFVAAEAARQLINADSYALRAVAFIPLAAVMVIAVSYIAGWCANCCVGRGIYRIAGFIGTVSLETYLLFERVRWLLASASGYETPAFSDMLKLDISAMIISVFTGYALTLFTKKLAEDVSSIPVPKINSDIT